MDEFEGFERIARTAGRFTQEPFETDHQSHDFEKRDIHEKFPAKIRKLFDDTHYAQATFEAAKFLDKKVAKFADSTKSGSKLMQEAFKDTSPAISLNSMNTESEKDEQRGYRWIFTGSVWAIRNPRGHEFDVQDDVSVCLDHLSFISMLMRRLEMAGLHF